MGNEAELFDLARARRMRFEDTKTDFELARLTFDEYGHPLPLVSWLEVEPVTMRERLGDLADVLIVTHPVLARRLGLFPPLRLVEVGDGNEGDGDQESDQVEGREGS